MVIGGALQDHAENTIIKTLPASREREPLFIVGDVHGCARELADLIKKAKERISKFQLVLVGDLFTKGPDPVGVLEQIQEHKALCIKGNHDWALWASIVQAQKRGLNSLPEHTQQTLHLIRYHKRSIFELLSSLPHGYTSTVSPRMIRRTWEKEYPLVIVHAGIDATKGLEGSSERMLLTARYVRWDNGDNGEKKIVVVPSGYRSEVLQSQQRERDKTVHGFDTNELTATYVTKGVASEERLSSGTRVIVAPSGVERFRWHELHHGPQLIVFGHDAKQGLFRKTLPTGRPICVGVDTGCTYGRALTGYFPELDDAIQVPARRAYFDIVKNVILIRSGGPRVAV